MSVKVATNKVELLSTQSIQKDEKVVEIENTQVSSLFLRNLL